MSGFFEKIYSNWRKQNERRRRIRETLSVLKMKELLEIAKGYGINTQKRVRDYYVDKKNNIHNNIRYENYDYIHLLDKIADVLTDKQFERVKKEYGINE